MGIGITSLTAKTNYVDTKSINEIAKQIFANAETKSQAFELTSTDLSKFRRPEVGIDLYSNKNNIDVTKQIAIRNAGLDINLNANFIANVQY